MSRQQIGYRNKGLITFGKRKNCPFCEHAGTFLELTTRLGPEIGIFECVGCGEKFRMRTGRKCRK